MKLAAAALIAAVSLTTPDASAVLLWDYSTSNGQNTISGRLVTDGTSSDLAGPFTFQVLELKSVFLDNVPATFNDELAGFDLGSGSSKFQWNGTAVEPPVFVLGTSADGESLVEIDLNIDDPDNPFFSARVLMDGFETRFEPSDTRFTPVPQHEKVPENSDFCWAIGAGMLALHARRHLRRR